jgi:hypothetical protein
VRILVTTAPGYGHVFAPVPLAWALRAAGHEVVLATAGRPEADIGVAAWCGLPVVDVAGPERIAAVRAELRMMRQRQAAEAGVTMAELLDTMREQARAAAEVHEGNPFTFAADVYGPFSAAMADGLVDLATGWRPDLVVYETMQGAGPLVAGRLGVPSVELVPGLCRGPQLSHRLREYLADDYARHSVDATPPVEVIELAPPSVAVNQPYGRPSRYVPFNGPCVLTDHPRERPTRPRIAVTFGSVVPHRLGVAPVLPVLAAAGEVAAEFILALGPIDPADVGPVPDNVRVMNSYVPLSALLPTCAAVIHHGGPATVLATLDAGLPHLVLPQMADQFVNAEALRRRGCGLVADGTDLAPTIGQLLVDPGVAAAAKEVRAEMAALPSPHETAERLVALV